MRSLAAALLWCCLSVVVGCIPFAIPEARTSALVENRDEQTYYIDFDEAGIEPDDIRLAAAMPPGPPAWALDVPGHGRGDLVLLFADCRVLDRHAFDGDALRIVVVGGRSAEVQDLGTLDHSPPSLSEVDLDCVSARSS